MSEGTGHFDTNQEKVNKAFVSRKLKKELRQKPYFFALTFPQFTN